MSTFTFEGTENRMRWDRRSRGFIEVWFCTLNHGPTGAGVWIRYTITSPDEGNGDPYCELWGAFFDPEGKKSFVVKEHYPIDRLGAPNGRDDGALVRVGPAWLSETHLDGAISNDDHTMKWSLDMEPASSTFQHFPPRLRGRAERKAAALCSPNLSVPFDGAVEIDGETFEMKGDIGCQSHRWGRRNVETWTWAHCGRFDGTDAVFEGVAGRSKLGPITAPTTTLLYLRYQGMDLAFNDVRGAMRARSRYEMPRWAFTAHDDEWKIAGAARAIPERMLQVTYVDPDTSKRFCANSEIADLGIEVYRMSSAGWRHHGSLTALGTAHIEFGRRDPFIELPISV